MRRSSAATRLGHLHEAQDALLHPGAAGRLEEHDRQPLGRRALEEARDLLAGDAAHRAAHEREEERAPRDRDRAVHAARARSRRPRWRATTSAPPRRAPGSACRRRTRAGRPARGARPTPRARRRRAGGAASRRRRACGAGRSCGHTSKLRVERLGGERLAAAVALAEDALAERSSCSASVSGSFLSGHGMAGYAASSVERAPTTLIVERSGETLQRRLGLLLHLARADAGRDLAQDEAVGGDVDDRELGDDAVHDAAPGERQSALASGSWARRPSRRAP